MIENKFILSFILVALILIFVSSAYAHDYRHTKEIRTVSNPEGVALAIATSQLKADWSTSKFQLGVGMGSFGGDSALAFGVAKRAGKVLINGSVGFEGNKTGLGLGINMRF